LAVESYGCGTKIVYFNTTKPHNIILFKISSGPRGAVTKFKFIDFLINLIIKHLKFVLLSISIILVSLNHLKLMEASFNTSHGTGKVVRQALSESNNLIKTASDNRIINLIKQRLYDSSDSNKSMDEYKDGSDKKIIDHFNICLTSSDLFRLYPGGWLNDNVSYLLIYLFLNLLQFFCM
jgi:hypothetical protein